MGKAFLPSTLLSFFFLWFLLLVFLTEIECTVTYDAKSIVINGQRRILISGSIHYPRSTPEMWEGLIQKAKDGGVDVIQTYVLWNGHEPSPGNYNFQGTYDLVKFLKTVHKAGLYAHLRIGGFYEPQGGPIILSQIENEYGLRVRHLGFLVIITWIGTGKWLLECKQVFHGSCARRRMPQIRWNIIVLDKYMQRCILRRLYSKPTLQTKNVDRGMEWLENNAVVRSFGEKRVEEKLKNHELVELLDIADLIKGHRRRR